MSIIKHVTLQKIVAHDFRYDLRIYIYIYINNSVKVTTATSIQERMYDRSNTEVRKN